MLKIRPGFVALARTHHTNSFDIHLIISSGKCHGLGDKDEKLLQYFIIARKLVRGLTFAATAANLTYLVIVIAV